MAAIYMWFQNEVQVWTTTLYPIEVIDALQLGAQLGDGCNMLPIPNENIDTASSLVSMDLRQILKTTGPHLEGLDTTESLVLMDLPTILKVIPTAYEALDTTPSLVSMSLDLALVRGDTPDEGMLFSCNLSTADCSMTPV